MAWSIFTQGGGPSAAEWWAISFLKALGAPQTPGNEQFVYDWEKSEGGGGKYNPLNQGPVPGDPSLTTTGSQYGGGAADYASVAAGIQGAVDYLNMGNYAGVKAALDANNPQGAAQALWASPWAASHYGYGSDWSTAPWPGEPPSSVIGNYGALANGSTAVETSASSSVPDWLDPFAAAGGIWHDITGLFSGVGHAVTGTEDAAKAITSFFALMMSPETWIRFGEVLVGTILISGGIAVTISILAKTPPPKVPQSVSNVVSASNVKAKHKTIDFAPAVATESVEGAEILPLAAVAA